MAVYRLEPIPENADSDDWRLSKWKGVCWVDAKDEGEARLKVEAATLKMADGLPAPHSPWPQKLLVTCSADHRKSVPDGVVLRSDGTTIPIPNP